LTERVSPDGPTFRPVLARRGTAAYGRPVPYVGVGRRFLAFLIDYLLSLVWTAPFADVDRSPGHFRASLTGGPFLAVVLIWFTYYVVMETAFGGTIGKLAMGLRVVRADGTPLDLAAIVKRTLARAIDGIPYGLPYLVGAIAVWTSPKHQRLGDRWAGTVVVPAGTRLGGSPPPPVAGTWTGAPWAGPPPSAPMPPMPPPPPMPGDPGSTP
jgi:uncharacterized RDD family membrane protein YckC